MSFTISVETAPASGTYADLTAYLLFSALQPPLLKANTLDFALLDPPTQTWISAASVGCAVKTTDPSWKGTIASVMTVDPVDLRNSHVEYAITATNADVLVSDTAPFDLSDVPSAAPPFDYLLEDGTGHYLLEAGTDYQPGALMLEGALAYGYSRLSVRTSANLPSGPNKILGQVTVYKPGIRPGHNFKLTSLNQGYAAAPFQAIQVGVSFPVPGTPSYYIEFGDAPATLAAWAVAHAAPVVLPPIPTAVPAGPSIFGVFNVTPGTYAQGGGIVTIGSSTFSVSAGSGQSMTVQIISQFLGNMIAWDDYVAVPRRAVRAVLSGGIYTGTWQEMPFGQSPLSLDLSSAPGIALPAGTYTLSVQINTQEFNQMVVTAGWAQAVVTTA